MTLYAARVEWHAGDTMLTWDRFVESVVKVFGLPGERYVTELHPNYMDFKFYNEQDRVLFLTGWRAKILPEQH